MAKAKSKALTPVKEQLPEVRKTQVDLSAWGIPDIKAKDILIPKIFAMQAMSKLVTAGVAKFGEFRDSLNNSVIGDETHPIEFIPFHMEKCYVVFKKIGGQFKFLRQVPITPANEDQDFLVQAPDGEEKWYRTSNFYVLMPNEIVSGSAIPWLLTFRSSSSRAGQKLATMMYLKNLKAGKTPASTVIELSGKKTSNDKGTFIVMDVREIRPSTDAEVAEAFEWVKTVRSGKVQVDHSDLEAESNSEPLPEPETSDF